MEHYYTLVGGDGSPYSCKLRAYLRFRRLPFVWESMSDRGPGIDWKSRFPQLRAKVIPVLVRPDGTYANDSTPLIQELEREHTGRGCLPAGGGLRFLQLLLEDFADEWCTKPMFGGRFHTEWDAQFGAAWQILSSAAIAQNANAPAAAQAFAQRQRGRRELVGCEDWAVMERTITEVCRAIEAMLAEGNPFLFGGSPSVADFALFGQMRQWAADPRPSTVMHKHPAAWGWTWRVDDLSGYEPLECEPKLTTGAAGLLRLAGMTYVPFMRANNAAVASGGGQVSVTLFQGQAEHSQPSFKYQSMCWHKLQREYAALSGEDQMFVGKALAKAGIPKNLFEASARL